MGSFMGEQALTLPVTGMSCVNCAANIHKTLDQLDGVTKVNVNFAAEQAMVSFDPDIISLEGIVTRVKELGFDLIVAGDGMDGADVEEIARNREIQDQKQKFFVGAAFALPLFLLSMSVVTNSLRLYRADFTSLQILHRQG